MKFIKNIVCNEEKSSAAIATHNMLLLGQIINKVKMCVKNKIISAVLSGYNFFVLGQAGTGKSTIIEEIYHMLTSLGKVVKQIV